MADHNTETRAAIARILGSGTYLKWAASPFHLIDARKVAAEWDGTKRPNCGDPFALGIQRMIQQHRATAPPLPPPAVAIADIWTHDAAFTEGGLSNFAGTARTRAYQLGWRAVYVQLLHTNYGPANEAEMALSQWAQWLKVGWGTYGQGSDPFQDGKDAAAICRRLPALRGWKANGENWAEGDGRWKTEAFLRGWQEGGAPVPLGWSVNSSDTGNYPRDYDYETALSSLLADIDAQVYGADHPGLTVGACLANFAKTSASKPDPVPVNRTTMTFSVDGDGGGPFNDYRTWPGPRRLWRPDKATPATFEALAR